MADEVDPFGLLRPLRFLLTRQSPSASSTTEHDHDAKSGVECEGFVVEDEVQSLWSGYGRLVRVRLPDEFARRVGAASAIVKYVRPPVLDAKSSTVAEQKFAHSRKLRSYEVEATFYMDCALREARSASKARTAELLAFSTHHSGGESLLVLEDLDASGFARRVTRGVLDKVDHTACLRWLARFHATFLRDTRRAGVETPWRNLWERGTYWHLATRPAELERMAPSPLKSAARALDAALSGARFKTIVHGDAKEANFCFRVRNRDPARARSNDGPAEVAAVDFQYTGGGVGVQDVAYFIERSLHAHSAAESLDLYFGELKQCLRERNPHQRQSRPDGASAAPTDSMLARPLSETEKVSPVARSHSPCFSEEDIAELEREWRELFPVAMADLTRMWAGWQRPGSRARSSAPYVCPDDGIQRLVATGIAHAQGCSTSSSVEG